MLPNIFVIGAGRVGSRHVEALSKINKDIKITNISSIDDINNYVNK